MHNIYQLDKNVEALEHILANLRDADARELHATQARGSLGEFAAGIVEQHPMACFICGDDGEPIVVGGVTLMWPGLGLLWAFATDRFPEVALTAMKFTKRVLFPSAAQAAHRIECRVMAENRRAVRWIEALGGRREAIMPGFGRNQETFLLYSWVSEHVRTAAVLAPGRRRGTPVNSHHIARAVFH